jgi:hypothetical protein
MNTLTIITLMCFAVGITLNYLLLMNETELCGIIKKSAILIFLGMLFSAYMIIKANVF